MTPDQEKAILDAVAAGLEDDLRALYADLVAKIKAGADPKTAVDAVMQQYGGTLAQTMAAALSAILGEAVTAAAVMAMDVGGIALSAKIYAKAAETSAVVEGIVKRHAAGFNDARRLALELFEGYFFRPPAAEPLQIVPSNPRLPQYMREALLTDDKVRNALAREFARIQVDGLKTPALRAAYSQLLDAIGGIEGKAGAALLQNRLDVAFYERVRYFAQRIAQTELHKAYAREEAARIMADTDVEFVQLRRTPGGGDCICSLYCGRDVYGLGAGVYPKRMCPVPTFHPFCRCRMVPRPGLTGRTAGPLNEDADEYFLRRLSAPIAARVMGSKGKLDAVLRGTPADAVYNARLDPLYRVRTIGEVVP